MEIIQQKLSDALLRVVSCEAEIEKLNNDAKARQAENA